MTEIIKQYEMKIYCKHETLSGQNDNHLFSLFSSDCDCSRPDVALRALRLCQVSA